MHGNAYAGERMARQSDTAVRISAMLAHEPTRPMAVKELAKAFQATHGKAIHAAAHLGVSHRVMMYWVAEHPEVKAALEKARAAAEKAAEK